MNAVMTVRVVVFFVVLGPSFTTLASETPEANRTQPRVLVSPSARQRASEPAPSVVNTQSGSTNEKSTLVLPPEQEMLPVVERVRALEAEVRSLQAALADMRRENAAATSAIRGQYATLRGEYDAHKHFLDSGCFPSQIIVPGSKFDGCVYGRTHDLKENSMTAPPHKYGK